MSEMARPIKATPVLSLESYNKFMGELKKEEGKRIKLETKKISKETEEKLENHGPRW
jgi:hypothetical protein